MKSVRYTILPVLASTIWISASEFFRNEILAKTYWTSHYASLGLSFPSELINGAVWGIWSLMYAIAIYILLRRFNLVEAFLLSWLMGFVLMWAVVWNLNVLPAGLLVIAVPLSLLEAFIAAWIIQTLARTGTGSSLSISED